MIYDIRRSGRGHTAFDSNNHKVATTHFFSFLPKFAMPAAYPELGLFSYQFDSYEDYLAVMSPKKADAEVVNGKFIIKKWIYS